MQLSRTETALAGVLASLLVSAVAWYYYETFLLFLFVPFVPFLLRGRGDGTRRVSDERTCPTCGFASRDPRYEFCPVDGSPLE